MSKNFFILFSFLSSTLLTCCTDNKKYEKVIIQDKNSSALIKPNASLYVDNNSLQKELEDPALVVAEEASELLLSGNFDEIEKRLNQYIRYEDFLSDGSPVFSYFFSGVSGCSLQACDDKPQDASWGKIRTRIDEWKTLYPNSKFAMEANGRYYIELAWEYRTAKYSSEVEDFQMSQFKENLQRSYKILKEIEKKDRLPTWYSGMISTGYNLGESLNDLEILYIEGVSRYPDAFNIYYAWSMHHSKKWGGSTAQVAKTIKTIVDRTQEKYGNSMYARLWWLAHDQTMYKDEDFSWEDMKMGFEEIIKNYPDAWNLNNYARFACRASDHEKFTKLSKQISGNLLKSVWGSTGSRFKNCTEEMQYVSTRKKGNWLGNNELICAFKEYQQGSLKKAFFISDKGSYAYSYGEETTEAAARSAYKDCWEPDDNCQIFDIDGSIQPKYQLPNLDVNCCDYDNEVCSLRDLGAKANNGNRSAMYELAVRYLDGSNGADKNVDLGMEWLELSANKNYVKAMEWMGYVFESREYGRVDFSQSKLWYEKAAADGSDYAKKRLYTLEKILNQNQGAQ